MTCDFTSFSKVFQSYQDDGMLIMKGCVQWSSVLQEKTMSIHIQYRLWEEKLQVMSFGYSSWNKFWVHY